MHSIGWSISHTSIVRNDIDSVAEEVELRRSSNEMVFIYGGVGPLFSDATLGGIAKAFGVRLAPDEEFEEYLRHLIGEHCTGDRNEMAQLPEGITELLHHEKLPVPLIKCHNVIVFTATNIVELDLQWDCLIELTRTGDLFPLLEPYKSKHLTTKLSDVEIAPSLAKLCLEFPDIHIGCYRESRSGPIIISFKGKNEERNQLAADALSKKFQPGAFSDINLNSQET